MKKFFAILLAVAVISCYMPFMIFAEGGDEQDVSQDSSNVQIGAYYEVDDGTGLPVSGVPDLSADETEQSYEDGKVKVDKIIGSTSEENVFDVTLKVSTQEKIGNITSSPDAAAVLVIDCSGSMAGERIKSAKKAAQTFINDFAAEGAERKIAIVRYSGDDGYDGAKTVQSWTDAANLSTDSADRFCDVIEGLEASGGTNTEAGIMLGRNLLNSLSPDIENRNIILLTDGNPTFGVKDSSESKYETELKVICPWTWSLFGSYCADQAGNGSSTTCECHTDVEETAKTLKSEGIGTYAVYVGDERIDCKSRNCSLEKKSGARWLAEDCGFTTYSADDKDLEKLSEIFKKIIEIIEMKAQAWIVTDPMGENIQFEQFMTEASPVNEFEEKDGVITWDIKNSTRGVETEENGATVTTYTLKYRIRLNTLSENYSPDTYYGTNGRTGLTYLITEESAQGTSYRNGTAYFNIPSVKGFAGDLSFEKQFEQGSGAETAQFTLTAADNAEFKLTAENDPETGKVSFENIPSGHSYYLEETSVPDGYVKSDNQTVTVAYGETDSAIKNGYIINRKTEPESISVNVTKVWNDDNNRDGIRPESVTVQLLANGEVVEGQELTLNEEVNWTGTFENIAAADAEGETISYSIREVAVEGYTSEITGNVNDGFTITNTHTSEVVTVSGSKTWQDENNQDGKRPDSITVHLLKDGAVEDTKTVTASDNWSWTFAGLLKYEDGKKITYSITEEAVADYVTTYNGYNITNSYTPGETSVTVSKKWDDENDRDGSRPDNITVQLYKNGEPVSGETVILNEENQWTGVFTALPVNENGVKIDYTVKEVNVPEGYTAEVSGDMQSGFIITNTHTPDVPPTPLYKYFSVEKIWKLDDGGTATDSVKVQLLRNGQPYGEPIELTSEKDWQYTWYGLPYSGEYTVMEVDIPENFTASIMKSGSKATIVNDDVKTEDPEDPDKPVDPEDPDNPVDPDEPGTDDNDDTDNNVSDDTNRNEQTGSDIPQTGDSQSIGMWIVLAVTASGALGVSVRLRRKSR